MVSHGSTRCGPAGSPKPSFASTESAGGLGQLRTLVTTYVEPKKAAVRRVMPAGERQRLSEQLPRMYMGFGTEEL
jgi:hypothetical protein